MTTHEYRKILYGVKKYLGMEGYKVKILKHSDKQHMCRKCGGIKQSNLKYMPLPNTQKVITYVVAECNDCKINYLYRVITFAPEMNGGEVE